MKGAKGGKRDRIISLLFSNRNAKIKTEDEAQLEQNNILNIERQNIKQPYTPKEPVDVEIQEVTPKINNDVLDKKDIPSFNNEVIEEKTNSEHDEEKKVTIITPQPEQKIETKITEIKVDVPEITDQVPNDLFSQEEEQLEEELEFKIMDALETILKEDLYELEELEYEFKVLNEKQDIEVDYKEIEKLKEELEELIRKFELIKEKYEFYQDSNKNDYIEIDDEFIYDLIVEYKKEAQENTLIEQINEQVEKIEEYVGIIEKIIHVENNTDELEVELDEKLDKFEIRDEEFEKLKAEYENVENINNLIDTFNRKQDEIIRSLQHKIETSEEITKKIETTTDYVANFNRLIQMAILISMSKKIPPTPAGAILKTSLMLSAINAAAHFITTKENSKVVTTVKYTDYSKSIRNAANDTSTIITKIDNAFLDIQAIRLSFEKECGDYKNQIDEYDKLIKNLDKVEKELKEKQQIAKKYNKKFNKILHINNQKVKRLEELKTS